jgi:ubiquinone/menaquinone biosynthesis C-methylase UbiE
MTEKQQPFVWRMNTDGPETYERYIVPTMMLDWTEDLLAAGSVGPGTRVLDVACGTGIVARKAAARTGPGSRVAGLDANEGMLRVAGRCARNEGFTAVGWYCSDVSRMPFSPGEFDAILCHQGLQFFPDKTAALREMARVLAPGGRLALGVWGRPDHCPYVIAVMGVLEQYLGPESTTLFKQASSLSDPDVLLGLVRGAGFSDVHLRAETKISRHPSLAEFLPAYFSIFPVSAEIAAMPEEERARMFSGLAAALAPYRENDGFAVPTENYIVTARTS